MKQEVFVGKIVEKALKNSGVTLAALSKKMGVTRPTIYKLFEKKVVRPDTLAKIGSIINYDFSSYIDAQLLSKTVKMPKTEPEEVLYWRNKYIELLEEYNKVLKGKQK